jgi:hypothetical protein
LLPNTAAATSIIAFVKAQARSGARFQLDGLNGKPWSAVLEWLTEQTRLPVITTFKPVGTFTYVGPKGMKHTLPEVVALFNEGLRRRECVLLWREQSFVLVPADESIFARGPRQQGTAAVSAASGSASMYS